VQKKTNGLSSSSRENVEFVGAASGGTKPLSGVYKSGGREVRSSRQTLTKKRGKTKGEKRHRRSTADPGRGGKKIGHHRARKTTILVQEIGVTRLKSS